ncbi:MAG: alpha/beta hydrolase [Opitutaceae bacterium]|nr:alpha/beta hydrolase [Opitutaceae bacterium]
MRHTSATTLGVTANVPAVVADHNAGDSPTRYVEVNGDRIAYREAGRGATILLANRFRGTLDTWDPLFLDELARHRRVITFDYPGVGYSSGMLPSDMGQVVAFLDALVQALALEKFTILGWSWGGFAVQSFVVEHPERVTHAILLGTNPPGATTHAIDPGFLERALRPVNDLDDEEVLFFVPSSERSRLAAKRSHERIYARKGVADRIPSSMSQFKPFLDAHGTYRADASGRRARLSTLPVPLLIVSGDADTSNPVENWYPLIGKLPSAQFILISDTGHAPQHQHPELMVGYILEFLTRTQG